MTTPQTKTSYLIRISVQARFVPDQSRPDDHEYVFAYTVRIQNDGAVAAQLISRQWRIEDETGKVVEVRGLGVVGKQPLLQPGEAFEYTSGSHLKTATGTMKGSYFFVAEDGHRFDTEVPPFMLAAQRTLH